MFFHSYIAMEYAFTLFLFFTVNSSVNAAGYRLAGGSFMERAIELKTFPLDYVISRCGVLVRCSLVEPKVQGSSPT